jgi:superfamily II DNA or RNA helicase
MFKIALSATVFLEDDREAERGIIWLKGVFGPIRTDLSMSDLIEAGYLMRQNVKMYRITQPARCKSAGWSDRMRRMCLTHNPVRNGLIARLARKTANDLGMKVLIIARQLDHIDALQEEMARAGVLSQRITGRERKDKRRELVSRMVAGEYNVLIGTVLGEGVDIPSVECVINAEGGKDIKAVVQRQRNLTMSEGKRVALLIDFYDETNHYLEDHSKARLDAYQSEPAFLVEVRN